MKQVELTFVFSFLEAPFEFCFPSKSWGAEFGGIVKVQFKLDLTIGRRSSGKSNVQTGWLWTISVSCDSNERFPVTILGSIL